VSVSLFLTARIPLLINSPNANWANVKPAIAAAATFACSTSSGVGVRISHKRASAGITDYFAP